MDRSLPVWVVTALFLALLILLPMAWLVVVSVSGDGGAGFASYRLALTDPHLRKALWNTVVLAFWVGVFSLLIGAPMAWLTARTDLPRKRAIRALMLASFVTPPFLGAFAWVMLAGPNAGVLNKLYREITGAEGPLFDIFTMPGLIFAVTLYTFPYVFIMIANTLELIASDLEEAAAILGARRITVALTVTLPMVLPAIASGFILAVLQAMALFGSPAILALPAGFHTITTQIWSYFQYPPKVELAAAASMPLLVATALLLYLQKRLLGRRGYASVGGKSGQRRTIPLGAWRWPAFAACLAVMACSIFLPYAVLTRAALSRAWAQPLSWDNFTLGNIWFTFWQYSATKSAVVNTLELGIMTATVGALLAALLAYTVNRRLVPGSQLLPFLVLAPVVIPGVVLAVGLFIAYTRPPLVLYGTLWIMFAAFLTKELPIGYSRTPSTSRPSTRCTSATVANVMRSMNRPSTAMAPNCPSSLRSMITTEITLVLGVKRMIEADSSRMTPMKMKHQVAMMPLRASGAVISRSTRSRPAPRMRPASSSSLCTPRNVASDCE